MSSSLRPTLEFRRGDELVAHVVASPAATWFSGHFPDMPLLPGVAMLALVEDALLAFWPDAEQPPVEVTGYRRVRFRQRVNPGANLRVRVRRVEGERFRFSVELGGAAACTGECTVVAQERVGRLGKGASDLNPPRPAQRGEVAERSEAGEGLPVSQVKDHGPHSGGAEGLWAGIDLGGTTRFCSDGTTLAEVARLAAELCKTPHPPTRTSAASPLRGEAIRPLRVRNWGEDAERETAGEGALSVCVASEDRVEVAAAMVAALSGGLEALFPPALTPEAVAATWKMHAFSHWLGPREWGEKLAGLGAIRVAPDTPSVASGALALAAPKLARVFLQTGGTTGQPHVWPKTAHNLLDEVAAQIRGLRVEPDDHILATVPPHHIYGLLFSVLLPLCSGATVERRSPFYPQEIAERVERTGATILVSTPAHLRVLAETLSASHRLRLVLSSGSPLSATDAAAFHARTGLWPLEVYGSTETGGIAVRRQDVPACDWAPMPSVDCRVDDEVLEVRSPYVSRLEADDSSSFFRTADLAEIAPDGRFALLGRSDGIVKVGGQRVVLPVVEQVLAALAGVADAVVLALPSASGRGQEIVALAASTRAADELVRELREKLPSPSWPRRLRTAPAIPTTPSGKRDRPAILRLLELDDGEVE